MGITELQEQILSHEELTGLIAPDGTFYECPDCSHHTIKSALFGYNYSDTQLENWMHVGVCIGVFTYKKGNTSDDKNNASWAQQKVLDAILSSDACSYELKKSIYWYLS